MKKAKISPLVLSLVGLAIGSILALLLAYFLYIAVKPPPLKYTGELENAFLPTKGWFSPDLTTHIACSITNDILGKDYQSCIFRTSPSLNSSSGNRFVVGKEFEISVALEVDGPVNLGIEGEVVNNASMLTFEVYTHEDEPKFLGKILVEERKEFESSVVLPEEGEYVLYAIIKPYPTTFSVVNEILIDPLTSVPSSGITYGSQVVPNSETVTWVNETSGATRDLSPAEYTIDYVTGRITVTNATLEVGADIHVEVDYQWEGIHATAGDDVIRIDLELINPEAGVDVDEGHILIESG